MTLVAPADSFPHRAITRLREMGSGLPRFALLGGMAVVIRLGQAHRATADLDAVSDAQARMLELLVAAGHAQSGNSVVLESDMKLDILDVSVGDPEYVPYLTHRYAFDTRGNVDVRFVSPSGDELVRTSIATATASALVVMKLGISDGVGRQRDPRKVGSDAFDYLRLLLDYGPDTVAAELNANAGPELRTAVARLAEQHLIEDASRTAAALRRSSTVGVHGISVEQIGLLGRAFLAQLSAS